MKSVNHIKSGFTVKARLDIKPGRRQEKTKRLRGIFVVVYDQYSLRSRFHHESFTGERCRLLFDGIPVIEATTTPQAVKLYSPHTTEIGVVVCGIRLTGLGAEAFVTKSLAGECRLGGMRLAL
jgi:hypothetical protein